MAMNETLKKDFTSRWSLLRQRTLYFAFAPDRKRPVMYLSKLEVDASVERFVTRMRNVKQEVDTTKIWVGEVAMDEGRVHFEVDTEGSRGEVRSQGFREALKNLRKKNELDKLPGFKKATVEIPGEAQDVKSGVTKKSSLGSKLSRGKFSQFRGALDDLAKADNPKKLVKARAAVREKATKWLDANLDRGDDGDGEKAEQIWDAQMKVLSALGEVTAKELAVGLKVLRKQKEAGVAKGLVDRAAGLRILEKALEDARSLEDFANDGDGPVTLAGYDELVGLIDEIEQAIDALGGDVPVEDSEVVDDEDGVLDTAAPDLGDKEAVKRYLAEATADGKALMSDLEQVARELNETRAAARTISERLEADAGLKKAFFKDLKRVRGLLEQIEGIRGLAKPPLTRLAKHVKGVRVRLADYGSPEQGASDKKATEEHLAGVESSLDAARRGVPRVIATMDTHRRTMEAGLHFVQEGLKTLDGMRTMLRSFNTGPMEALGAKVPVLAAIDGITLDLSGEDDPAEAAADVRGTKHVAKQMTLHSTLSAGEITALVRNVNSLDALDAFVAELHKTVKPGTEAIGRLAKEANDLVRKAERFLGAHEFKQSLPDDLQPKWEVVRKAAKLDLGSAPMPYTGLSREERTKIMSTKTVAVMGGGPVGVAGAVQARLDGAPNVVLYEARTAAPSRLNVLKTTEATKARYRQLGIYDRLMTGPERSSTTDGAVPTKDIEVALRERASELGITIKLGWKLTTAERDETGRTKLIFEGKDPEYADLLIVAAGPGIHRPKGDGRIVVGKNLGFDVGKASSVDYAITLLTEGGTKSEDRGDKTLQDRIAWDYDFAPPDVNYVVTQLTEEEYGQLADDPELLKVFAASLATKYGLQGKELKANPAVFPIEILQAKSFGNEDLDTVLLGDSAGTPHPSTALGLNTGNAELDALADLMEAVIGVDPRKLGSDEERREAYARYEWEMKRRTDFMYGKALLSMASNASSRCRSVAWQTKTAFKKIACADGNEHALEDKMERLEMRIRSKASAVNSAFEDERDGAADLVDRTIGELRAAEQELWKLHRTATAWADDWIVVDVREEEEATLRPQPRVAITRHEQQIDRILA
jgi:hypothetical protein